MGESDWRGPFAGFIRILSEFFAAAFLGLSRVLSAARIYSYFFVAVAPYNTLLSPSLLGERGERERERVGENK